LIHQSLKNETKTSSISKKNNKNSEKIAISTVKVRFSTIDDCSASEELKRLYQTAGVNEYMSKFEKIIGRVFEGTSSISERESYGSG
jgi:hypothetical protein